MIFDIIGTPNGDDINFITDPKALYYVQSFPHKDPVDLQTLYPASDSVALDLLRRLLTFNPNERITLEEVINHPFLERVRDLGLEVDAENP
jgi:mitogen-activated protein kinase 1/3